MNLDYFENAQEEFDFPIVLTKELIKKCLKDYFKQNPNQYIIDLLEPVEVFRFFRPTQPIEEEFVLCKTEKLLLLAANSLKWVNEDNLKEVLTDFASKIRKMSLGGVIPADAYPYLVDQALSLKDTIEVIPNDTIRFITNPFYKFKENEYKNRKELKFRTINKILGDEASQATYNKIYNCIVDYNLSDKCISKKIIAKKTGLGYTTIKNYVSSNPELKEVFEAIKDASRNQLQKQNRKYYLSKISKMASD